MPKVLILCEYGTISGGEQSMLATLPTIASGGWDVHLAAPSDGPLLQAAAEQGAKTIPWTSRDADGGVLPEARRHAAIHELLDTVRPDLLHANSLSMGKLSGPVVAERGLASIAHLRDIIGLSRRAIDCLNLHARLLAVSAATRSHHVGQGLDGERCRVLHNGVDLDRFRPREATGRLHDELGIPRGAPLVGAIGQIGLRKGLDTWMAAAERIATARDDVHFLLVGERWSDKDESRRFEEALRRRGESPPLAGRVHWLGYRADVANLLNEWTVLLHSARQEPLGRVLLEAAASGTAVVATDVGGTREIFPSSTMATVTPVDDDAAMADAVLAIVHDDALRRSHSQHARRRAEEAFDIRLAAANLLMHYNEVVG